MKPHHRFPPSICPSCGAVNDSASDIHERGPGPGDFSVCLYCGHLQAYGDDMALRELTDAEAIDVAGDPELLAVSELASKLRRAWLKMKGEQNADRTA